MGFLDFLSPALTSASTAYGAYQQGAQQKNEREQADVLKLIAMQRQKRLDDEGSAMHAAQMANYKSQADLRTQTGLKNRRAFEALKTAGEQVGEYNDAEDYVTPLQTRQKEGIEKGKTDRANSRYRQQMKTLYGTDATVGKLIASEDPDNPYDWAKLWQDRQDEERQGRQDTRQDKSIAAQDARQAAALAAAMSRAQFGVDNRPVPQGMVKDESALTELSNQANDVKAELDKAVNNKERPTGPIIGMAPLKLLDYFNVGGEHGATVRDKIQNLFGTVAKQRGGTALTEYELNLLKSYLPDAQDSPKRASEQAANFVKELNRIIASKQGAYGKYYPKVREINSGGGMRQAPPASESTRSAAPGTGGSTARDRARAIMNEYPKK